MSVTPALCPAAPGPDTPSRISRGDAVNCRTTPFGDTLKLSPSNFTARIAISTA